MKTKLFDYNLPKYLIAQTPVKQRDQARLMVIRRGEDKIEHDKFYGLIKYLNPGDVLVLNNTKVLPVKLLGKRKSGGLLEILLVNEIKPDCWEILVKGGGKLREGEILYFRNNSLSAKLERRGTDWFIKFPVDIRQNFASIGKMPLPPYIKRPKNNDPYESMDKEHYQTVYASVEGAIAAPTAGLHFTAALLDKLASKGVRIVYLTLHIGRGTFKPITAEEVDEHQMDKEYFEVNPETINTLIEAYQDKKRIIAVGTTVCRTLETIAGHIIAPTHTRWESPLAGWADLFIHPPYQFKLVSGLITNFHLPKGTPLILTSAFAGREKVLKAYEEAIKQEYRFYSYGDAMMIL